MSQEDHDTITKLVTQVEILVDDFQRLLKTLIAIGLLILSGGAAVTLALFLEIVTKS